MEVSRVECEVCGKELRIFNRYGVTVGTDSCPHWRYCGEVYPYLWDEESQRSLELEEEAGLVILESREQGGYYLWEMTPLHPEFEECMKKYEALLEERGLE